MRDSAKFIREAYINLLRPLTVDGVVIPFFDEIVNPNASLSSYLGADCYIVFSGQNEVETTNNRCSFRENVAVTLQIFAEYPLGSGGKRAVENISDAILQQLRVLNEPGISLASPFQVLQTRKLSAQTLIFNGMKNTTYQKNLNISHVVYQDDIDINAISNTIQSTLQFQL